MKHACCIHHDANWLKRLGIKSGVLTDCGITRMLMGRYGALESNSQA